MSKRKGKIKIPPPEVVKPEIKKFKIGEPNIPFYDTKHMKPIFAFDYLSLNESDLCFNKETRTREDLLGFLGGLKNASCLSYEELDKQKPWRFHTVDLDDKEVNLNNSQLLDVLCPSGRGLTEDELPPVYQFDTQHARGARIMGFIYRGIFHIIWYDRDHIVYPEKK